MEGPGQAEGGTAALRPLTSESLRFPSDDLTPDTHLLSPARFSLPMSSPQYQVRPATEADVVRGGDF